MSFPLDETDIAILNSLIEDGRKSFRQISREIKVSTPTVQIHYNRLKSMGIIKSISPVLDMKKLRVKTDISKIKIKTQAKQLKKFETNLHAQILCDYCDRKCVVKPSVLRIKKLKRYFCCPSCRLLYKQKYKHLIQTHIDSQD